MRQTDFARALTSFLSEYLPGQRGASTNTITSYRDTFKQLLIFFDTRLNIKPEHLTFEKLKVGTVIDFLNWIEKTRGVSVNTRNQRLAAIKSFFRYSQSEYPDILFKCQRIMGIAFKKRSKKTISYLDKESIKYILEEADTTKKRGLRDLAIMATLYDTGARVKELIDLKAADVRLDSPATIMLKGKGGKQRCVPVMGKTRSLLEKYMMKNDLLRNEAKSHPLFFNSRNHPFTRPGITYILNKYLRKAKGSHSGISFPESLHPHLFRHSKAVHLLEAGVNLIYIRDILGHVNVTTTEIYLRINMELKRKALESVYMELSDQDIPVWQEDTDLLSWLDGFCR
jgi:integrase/recombinase XerD